MVEFNFPEKIFKKFDLSDYSNRLKFEKDELLTDDVMDHRKISLIESGIVILYWIDEKGEKVIIDFKSAGQVLRPAVEISEEEVGKIYVWAYHETELVVIERQFMCECTFESDKVSDFFYGLLTKDIDSTYKQLKLLKEADLEKRYEIFLNDYKHIYNDISDRLIASYLGVHYTTLSRIKRKFKKSSKNYSLVAVE